LFASTGKERKETITSHTNPFFFLLLLLLLMELSDFFEAVRYGNLKEVKEILKINPQTLCQLEERGEVPRRPKPCL